VVKDHLHHSRLKIRDADWLARVKPRSDSPAKAIKASIRPWPDAVPLIIMSTKNSLAYSHDNSFHLYTECFDSGKSVWLELNKCAFEASERGIKVEIPIAVWEVIRQQTPARFDLADLTNAQIKAKAENRVAEQRAKYLEASKGGNKKRTVWLRLCCGDANLPEEDHFANVLTELRFARASQRKLLREIARHAPKPMSPAKESPLPTEAKA
jgi:hypothetical protein